MSARKPSKPWRLVLSTAGGPVYTTHRSKPATYRAIDEEKRRVADGTSRVTRITVDQWDVDGQQWQRYENAWDKNTATQELPR
ncbi:hypothetical protein [Streptomyces sp. SM13]|uniref:hypothetical protein n=1 Tax=Streptomyces sp. SM13 TaxID=1983803 RepID=UPI000CD4CE0D|nr:hypothetical protein [Streptomyces sp. SM13]